MCMKLVMPIPHPQANGRVRSCLATQFYVNLQSIMSSLVAVLITACLGIANAEADIFVFTDETGTQHFSDVPDDSRYTLFMHSEVPRLMAVEPQRNQIFSNKKRETYSPEIKRAALSYKLDEALLHAVISAESGYNSRSISNKGAMGLMQLMPDTSRRFRVTNSFDPAQNIYAGAQYLSKLLVHFDNNLPLALAAYNAGENNVRKYGDQIPPFPETRAYVIKVINNYQKFK